MSEAPAPMPPDAAYRAACREVELATEEATRRTERVRRLLRAIAVHRARRWRPKPLTRRNAE